MELIAALFVIFCLYVASKVYGWTEQGVVIGVCSFAVAVAVIVVPWMLHREMS